MRSLLRSLLYKEGINKIVRGLMRLMGPLVPDRYRINPSGLVNIRVNSEISLKLSTNQTSYVTRRLYWNDPLEFEYTSVFLDLIKKVDTFWDVGANIGYYSILGTKINPDLKVEAFEPSIGPLKYLSENLRINEVSDKIQVHPYALSNASGDIDFYEVFNPKFPKILNLSGEHNTGTKRGIPSQKVTVAAKRLSDIRLQTPPIDLVKIDVEGAEVAVLRGGLDAIKKDRPIVICELLFDLNESELESYFKDLEYSFFAHIGHGLKRITSLTRKEDNGIRDVFFVPLEKEHLVTEFEIL
ncbi:FkbM family methyltransferase [Poritiphilus flavus]|uniref:FkbM family methyltransferase n=1 Tax=Poritiphilus flavus TaxID=2697053 RepID=A0A6L9EE96_9FLAO|nr:FkbM family methyltransferase [Poritiphilus flavus]NAS13036.1 FkbM family methyltransferase [Poritiphilus flavus]